jgi:hypothetical protein
MKKKIHQSQPFFPLLLELVFQQNRTPLIILHMSISFILTMAIQKKKEEEEKKKKRKTPHSNTSLSLSLPLFVRHK